MIAVTGGAGFIGSAIIWRLNTLGEDNIICVDELGQDDKWKNLVGLKFVDFINKHDFINNLEKGLKYNFNAIIHMGANSSTTEKDADHLIKNNFEYTKGLAAQLMETEARALMMTSYLFPN
jgi:ADP-L-glycero-D-manno-heptose 6-epimerase